jgi:CubicO group peptidase (beta-lactamase class C family)
LGFWGKMGNKLILTIIVIAFLISGCRQETSHTLPTSTNLEDRIERVENGLEIMYANGRSSQGKELNIFDRMDHYNVPGVGIAVIEDFEIDWAKGYGFHAAGGDIPVTEDSLFNAGSITKMFSAAAALKLVKNGKLDLDQDVNEMLISWQVPENEFTVKEKVTLRRLLSHSGGIQDGFTNRSGDDIDTLPDYLAPGGEEPAVMIQELLEGAPGIDVDGPTTVAAVPGSEYAYANADYAILELLLVDQSGKSFPEFMSETILEPLALVSSTFEKPLPPDLRAKAVWEHYADGTPFEQERLHFPFSSVWITPRDLARFVVDLMQAYNGHSEQLISQELAQEMLSPQINIPGHPLMDAYGFGFDLQTKNEPLVAFHTGGTWGSTAIVLIYPETGQGAVVMTNSANGSNLRFEILFSIATEYGWPGTW